jgi:hypothetical protein
VILGVLVVVGAAVFFFFRYSFTAEGLYRVQTAVGMDATQPERHIVPEGFQGWAILRFGIEGADPLPVENNTLIVEYPPTGFLETSTPGPDDAGFLHREHFVRTEDGLEPLTRTGEIWGEYNMVSLIDDEGNASGRSTGFFVGTLTEFRQTERPHAFPELPDLPSPPD